MSLQKINYWFAENKRSLPWRENTSPYHVWISEIMLQQTRVEAVIEYFQRWMSKYPTIKLLANAPIEEVIKIWEGLGYYSRARNIHKASKIIMTQYNGIFPGTYEEIINLPGIGAYTAGAILSFSMKQRYPAVDGNVLRVLSRYLGCYDDISKQKTRVDFESYLRKNLPMHRPWETMEGLIELGALICKPHPKCTHCPLKDSCRGLKENLVTQLPVKTKKNKCIPLSRRVFCLIYNGKVAIKKNLEKGLMQDLFEFPYLEIEKDVTQILDKSVKPVYIDTFNEVMHTYTKYKVTLIPELWKISQRVDIQSYKWVSFEELSLYPFSSGHKKIAKQLLDFIY